MKTAGPTPATGALALLATAIAGRPVMIRVDQAAISYLDGDTIVVSSRGDGDRTTTSVVVLAALMRDASIGGLAPGRRGRGTVAARFLTLEAARATHALGHLMPRRTEQRILAHWHGTIPADAEESRRRASTDGSVPPAPADYGMIRSLPTPERPIAVCAADDPALALRHHTETGEAKSTSAPTMRQDENAQSHGKSDASALPQQGDGAGAALTASIARVVGRIAERVRLIAEPLVKDTHLPEGDALRYPEWDYRIGVYRPSWCRIVDFELVPATQAEPGNRDQRLRRRLARLGTRYERHPPNEAGDSLDIDSLIRFMVDRASGYSGAAQVFEYRQKTRRDLSALILVDASASSSDQPAGGRSTWAAQRTLAQDLITAFAELGDAVAGYAFRSLGRGDVRFLRIKEFGERFGMRVGARLRSLEPFGYTRLGAAIRRAADLVAASGTENQLLVIVSDGLAYDHGYEGVYAAHDVRHAIRETQHRGIGCVSISVGGGRKTDSVSLQWRGADHVVLNTPADAVDYAEPLFRHALRGVQRSSTRDYRRRAAPAYASSGRAQR